VAVLIPLVLKMTRTSLSEGQCHATSFACMQALSQQGYHAVWLCAKNGTLLQFYKQLSLRNVIELIARYTG